MSILHAAALVSLVLPVQSLTLMPVSSDGKLAQRSMPSNCGFGHVIPEFYLLGAKNSATSSLARDLRERGGVLAAPDDEHKEWQFLSQHAGFPDSLQFQLWLDELPECGKQRAVVADFSVTNLFMADLPADFEWSPKYGYGSRPGRHADDWSAARLISLFHQMAGTASAVPPKFIVMLRDPLARTQSEYYHTLRAHSCRGCGAADNFADSFAVNVALLGQGQMSDWFWKNFYARQIEPFEEEFDASQFMFVPSKEYYAFDPKGFSSDLESWLGLAGAAPWASASHANEHDDRPPLDSELPVGNAAREAYADLMEPECQRLVQLLSRMQQQGAVLAGYTGSSGDEAAVRSWLERGW